MGARRWKQPGPTECTLYSPWVLEAPPPPSHFMFVMYCTTVHCTCNSTLHSGNYSTLVPTHRRMHDKDKKGTWSAPPPRTGGPPLARMATVG